MKPGDHEIAANTDKAEVVQLLSDPVSGMLGHTALLERAEGGAPVPFPWFPEQGRRCPGIRNSDGEFDVVRKVLFFA